MWVWITDVLWRYAAAWFIIFVGVSEPNLSSAEPDRAAGAAPGGKPPNHQPHKGLCDGAHRHRSCVSQWPPAIQKCQWFLGATLRRPPHFPRCQAPGLPICCRQPWPSRRSGEVTELLVVSLEEICRFNFRWLLHTYCGVSSELMMSWCSILDAGCILPSQVWQPWRRRMETGLRHYLRPWWVGQWAAAGVCGPPLPQWSRWVVRGDLTQSCTHLSAFESLSDWNASQDSG